MASLALRRIPREAAIVQRFARAQSNALAVRWWATVTMSSSAPIRVLVAKPGLDGHDRGAKIIARALSDAGMEVIYTGLRRTPDQIVKAALEEDVEFIGLSILSGAHSVLVPRILERMKAAGMDDVPLLLGGIIPDDEVAELKSLGVAEVFTPGTSLSRIVDYIRENRPRRTL